jgi:hypothetical protein
LIATATIAKTGAKRSRPSAATAMSKARFIAVSGRLP